MKKTTEIMSENIDLLSLVLFMGNCRPYC